MMNKHDKRATAIVQQAFAAGQVAEVSRTHDGAVMISVGRPSGPAAVAAAAADAVQHAVEESERKQKAAAAQIQDDASGRLGRHREWMLRGMLGDMQAAGLIASADPIVLEEGGVLKGYKLDDGAQVWEVNGVPVIIFERPTAAFDTEFFNVNQIYRVRL